MNEPFNVFFKITTYKYVDLWHNVSPNIIIILCVCTFAIGTEDLKHHRERFIPLA